LTLHIEISLADKHISSVVFILVWVMKPTFWWQLL